MEMKLQLRLDQSKTVTEPKQERERRIPHFVPSARDLEVLRFISEMKFGYVPILKHRFYATNRAGDLSISDRYTRNRLSELKTYGVLATEIRPKSRECLYVTTAEGEYLVARKKGTYSSRRPSSAKYDYRIFDHDLRVILSRLALEESGRALKWIPERDIQSVVTRYQGLARKYLPDGLYENQQGQLVAFEMEVSQKGRDRYQDKINKYVVLFNSHFNTPVRFARALFVCTQPGVYKTLTEMTRIHGEMFRVEYFSDLTANLSEDLRAVLK